MVVAAVDALGTGLILPIGVLYLVLAVGASESAAALVLSLAGVATAGALTPLGALIDRRSAREVTIGCYALGAAAAVGYAHAGSLVAAGALFALLSIANGGATAARAVLAAELVDAELRVRLLALTDGVRNFVFALGGVVTALALAVGGESAFTVLILFNALTFALAAVACLRLPAGGRRMARSRRGLGVALRDRRFVGIAAIDAVMWLHSSFMLVAVPLWVVERTDGALALSGMLLALNAVLVALLLYPLSRRAVSRAGAARIYLYAGLSIATACLILGTAGGGSGTVAVVALVAAVVLITLGEVLGRNGANGIALSLAPAIARGRYLSLFSTGFSVQRAYGPALATWIVVLGPAAWLALVPVFALAPWVAGRLARAAPRRDCRHAT